MNLTSESARAFAQNVLNRVKGTYKTMDMPRVDDCTIYIRSDGYVELNLRHFMSNQMIAEYTYPCSGEILGEENFIIKDAYGNDVA